MDLAVARSLAGSSLQGPLAVLGVSFDGGKQLDPELPAATALVRTAVRGCRASEGQDRASRTGEGDRKPSTAGVIVLRSLAGAISKGLAGVGFDPERFLGNKRGTPPITQFGAT